MKMSKGMFGTELSQLKNIQSKLDRISGLAVACELYMRIIAQYSDETRIKTEELISAEIEAAKKTRKKLSPSKEIHACSLKYLQDAIISVFRDLLNEDEIENLNYFNQLRNKLLHADFVGLMQKMNVDPTGRQLFKDGSRELLSNDNIIEAAKSFERNQIDVMFQKIAGKTLGILEKIIFSIGE